MKLSLLTEKHEYRSKVDSLFLIYAGRLDDHPSSLPTLVTAIALHGYSITSVSINKMY